MGAAATEPSFLTPHGGFEGSQDVTNRAFVAGWAWDRSKPAARIDVEIRDGGKVLATVAADAFRKDLRDAGIGDGRHGFAYLLDRHIRDRRSHRIVACIAGTDVALRDSTTGAAARPVTRRDQPTVPPIPHFSLSPLQRWVYFTALRRLLRVFPHPVLRPPALILGTVQMILDRQVRTLNVALLRALGMSTSLSSRWRLHWSRAYQQQIDLLLLAQVERVTPPWVARQVRFDGALPQGGAILVSVHHNARRFASLALASSGYRLGTISARTADPVALVCTDATLRAHWRLAEAGGINPYSDRWFPRREAGRKGLRLLAEGGYLVVDADEYARQEPFSPLLGRAMTVPRGAVWFAEYSGKPVIPYVVVPDGLRWRLCLGQPISPTQQGLCDALEGCIRQAPGSWQRNVAMAWMDAPPWGEQP